MTDATRPDAPETDRDDAASIDELRVVIECADWDLAVDFYRRALGLEIVAGYASPHEGQLLLEVGSAFIELVHPELPNPETSTPGPTAINDPAAPKIRLSFRSHDPAATVARMEEAGAERIAGPELTTSHSVTARLIAPDNLPVSVFKSYDNAGFSEPAIPPTHLPSEDEAGEGRFDGKSGIHSLIYSSRVATEFDDDDLVQLLATSRRNNDEVGLTGVLLYREGRFLQYLEGPRQALLDRVRIIAADERHTSFVTLLEEDIPQRLFPAWSMGFERLTERGAADMPGYRKSIADLADADRDPGTRGVLHELSQWFAARSGAAQI